MRAHSGLNELYRQAAAATAAGSKSFYFATRFFPEDLARSAHAVYWFCRTTDDLVDECPSVGQGRADLEQWALDLREAFATGQARHPVLSAFIDTVARHGIPHQYAYDLIEGMRMDLDGTRYATFEDLTVFCYRVASVVGLMMTHVIGFRDTADRDEGLRRAIDLGIAMQLTNILRDVGEDLARGRLYLPAEDMLRFGYGEEQLRRGERNAAFRHLMDFQIARARRYFAQAEPGIALLDPRGSFAVRVAADVYARILHRIEANDYDVFSRRAVVPPAQKYWLTAKAMTGPMIRHSVDRLAFWKAHA